MSCVEKAVANEGSPDAGDKRTVLVMGNCYPSLAVLPSLHGAGCRVVMGYAGPDWPFRYSRFVEESWLHPSIEEAPEAFIGALVRFLTERPDISHVFPVSETSAALVAANASRMPPTVTLVTTNPSALAACLDKCFMHEIAHELGIPVRSFVFATNLPDLYRLADNLGYPCVVKPPRSAVFAKKVVIAQSRQELRAALPEWPDSIDRLILQPMATGNRNNFYFAARNGELRQVCQAKVVRTDRFEGTGQTVEGVAVPVNPLLCDYTARLAKRLDYTGIGSAQYLVDDATGSILFLEINPRLGAAFPIALARGMDQSLLALELASGNDVPSLPQDYFPAGLRCHWLHRDLAGLSSSLARREITPRQAMTWAWRTMKACFQCAPDLGPRQRDLRPCLARYAQRAAGLATLGRKRRPAPDEAEDAPHPAKAILSK